MRISDWSSDVCSSDLPGHPCGPRGRPGPGPPDVRLRAVARDLASAPVRHLSGEPAGADLETPAPAPAAGCEIGRASCRERVCQYGKISVVGVSLKKKEQ